MLKNIQNQLDLIYLNTDEHTHLDKRADMAFISQNLSKHDIQFLISDDLGCDHLPIEIAIDAQPHRNIHTTLLGINLTRLTEKCLKQPSRRH